MRTSAAREEEVERGETRRDATREAGATPPMVALGECCTAIRGVTFPSGDAKSQPFDGCIGCLTTSGVQDEVAWDSARYIPDHYMRGPHQELRPGDLLVSTANSKALVGKLALVREVPGRVTFGAFVTVLRPLADLSPRYLFLCLRSERARRYFFEKSSETTNISNLGTDDMLALEIPLPPLAEQERIAGLLTEQLGAVERARAAAAQRLAAAEALPAALLREVFGDPPPFDASPLAPSTPTKPGWKWHRLTSLARLATGHTPSRRCPEYWNGDIPWIQLPDIRALDGRVAMDTSEHTNALGIENSAAVRLPAGTVCLSRTASVGFVTIMGREMATSQDFVNWVCGPDLDPSFLMHLFIACRKPIRDLGSGAVHHTIYFPTVEQFSVCVPDPATQRRLAAELTQRLAAAERVIARCREELAAIEALPASLLRDAFGQQSS